MKREMERMELSNEGHQNQITALKQKIRVLENENAELKAISPLTSPVGNTPLGSSFSAAAKGKLKESDAAAMANGCF
jgi:hypothetical protein